MENIYLQVRRTFIFRNTARSLLNVFLAACLLALVLSTAGAASVFEGAENGNGGFTMQVPAGYELITAAVNGGAGSHSFHFAHPIGANSIYPEDQWLMLNGQVVPAIGSRLQFKSRLTYSGGAQDAQVQVSSNGGATWQESLDPDRHELRGGRELWGSVSQLRWICGTEYSDSVPIPLRGGSAGRRLLSAND